MALGFCFGVAFLLSVWSTAKCQIPNEVLNMECRDRFFMIAVDLSFAGNEPHFEAVDETGVYPISEQYAATCGYSISIVPQSGHVELRASYFSCHTDNKDDEMFTFKFNLVATHDREEAAYALNKTCSPTLPWAPRDVTCEVNYMEVYVRNEVTCPSGNEDQNASLKPASATSDWQVLLHRDGEQLMPMNLSEAHKQGYAFDLTDGRLVFRTPYGQPDSLSTTVNGVPVEVVHATLFSRQSWVVLMVDLVAACSMYEGSYDESGYMMWETPEELQPLMSGLHETQINVGVNGELVEQPVAEERGYIVEKHNTTVQISIPYNAEGGYRKSLVSGDLYEFYVFDLYVEQISVDEDHVDTRLRFHRTLATPLLPRPVFSLNRTVLEDRTFTVYLGDVPEDVELAAVHLNGHKYMLPFNNTSSQTITKVVHPNNTHGYTLKVPFDDPVVVQKFSKEQAVLQYKLDVNYTMTILPENEPYYHLESVEALFTDVSPPTFQAVCSESGIRFKLDHRSFDYMWDISVGSDLLTSELAAQHGYILSNNSQSLLLNVPLFTHGYKYKDVTLKGFFGTFEILVRDHDTSEVQSSTVKTCPFTATELILCSTDGRMTVVADLSLAIPSGGVPARTNLVDKYCRPKEADDTKALFSFPLNGCGSTVKIDRQNVTYQNEIFFSKKYLDVNGAVSVNTTERVMVQCTYSLASLHRLFSLYKFESDKVGVGRIIHTAQPTAAQSPTIKPTTALKTTLAAKGPTRVPAAYLPAANPPVRYIRVSRVKSFLSGMRKGGSSQTKIDAAKIGRASNF
uniref:ZP domain-containing protein n=1 Tax=Dicentrarchus labrax TaxID=13489 RepID=A0A8P4KEK4_DICLA